MRNRVPEEATCVICGRYFDPSESEGWCPNPSCGQWRHPMFPLEGESDAATPDDERASASTAPTKRCPSCDNEVEVNENFCPHCAYAFTGDEEPTPSTPQPPNDDPGGLKCPDCGKDLSDIPTDRLSRCPICLFEFPPDFTEAAETPEPDDSLTECPNCGEDLTPIPSDMRTVCPGCRIDLDRGLDTHPPEAADGANAAPIATIDAIEPGFEHQLEDAGVRTVGDLLESDPEALSTSTGISSRRIGNWIEAARSELDVKPTEPTTPNDEPEFEKTTIQPRQAELVFEVMGREISVADGQTVGSEIRSAMVDAGASKEDAVYVHRKHVRIVADDGQFYLTRLGENSLELNGNPVDRGRRIAIEDGDELRFSDVVTVTVSVR